MTYQNTTIVFAFAALLMAMPLATSPVNAATVDLLFTINHPDPDANDFFGYSVATTPDGNWLIGALRDDTGVRDAGSAYLFNGTNGNLLLTINNPTPQPNDQFGYSVATTPDGNLLIGARGDDTGALDAGSAYLFNGTLRGTTKIPLLTINNPTPERFDIFGNSVATTPDGNLLIGAERDNTNATATGSAYLFDGTNGNLLLTINNPTPDVDDFFGNSVATTPNGDLLIGARGDNTNATSAGSAYLFNGTNRGITNTPLLTINHPDPDDEDNFGYSVATTPDGNLLIGAPNDNTNATATGSAYLFDGTNGNLLLTINNPDPDDDDSFGNSVATTPNGDLLIGAPFDDTGALRAGAVYIFAKFIIVQCGFDTSNAENINFGYISTNSTAINIGEKDAVFPAVDGNSASARVLVEVGDWLGAGDRAFGFFLLRDVPAGVEAVLGSNVYIGIDTGIPTALEFVISGSNEEDAANLADAIRNKDPTVIVSTGGTNKVTILNVERGSIGNSVTLLAFGGIIFSGLTLPGGGDTPQIIMDGETTKFTWGAFDAQDTSYADKVEASVGVPQQVLNGTANSDALYVALMIDPASATFRNLPYDGPLTQTITITIPSQCDGTP